jgi:hypothetical protein
VSAPITWAEATTPITWSAIGINWNTPARADTSTLAVSSGYSNINVGTLAAAASFANNLGKVHASTNSMSTVISFGLQNALAGAGGFTFENDISFGVDNGYTSSSILSAVSSITIPLTMTYVNATNHAESISVGSTMNVTSSGEFLWDNVSDVSTVWTDVEYPN